MPLCDFGCGKEATHLFKSSGKWCCTSNVNACDGKKEKDRQKKKGKNPWIGKEHPRGMLGKKAWNSGKNLENLLGKEEADKYKSKLSYSHIGIRHPQSDKTKKMISDKMKVVGGGYRQGSGRGKKGRYCGYWCDSSWELAYVIYCLDNHIKIERSKEKREYIWKGKIRFYYPDFIVDGKTVEIKGYETEQWKCKLKANNDVLVIGENEIKDILKYVIEKYGYDFIKLYDGRLTDQGSAPP